MNPEPLFRASEILDMAVEIERQGADFYGACAREATGQAVRDLFELLMDEERKHAQVFASMKEGLADFQLPESYAGEMRSYLDSLVQGRVFSAPDRAKETSGQAASPREAVDLAMEFEKSSILFYSGMKQVVPESEHATIERVIGQEHLHIRRLLGVRQTLE